jgi:hypothetical protein
MQSSISSLISYQNQIQAQLEEYQLQVADLELSVEELNQEKDQIQLL